MIKLREILKIKQGVDLLEEKIRKYFAYWLDICNTEVERQKIVCSSEDIYCNFFIIQPKLSLLLKELISLLIMRPASRPILLFGCLNFSPKMSKLYVLSMINLNPWNILKKNNVE